MFNRLFSRTRNVTIMERTSRQLSKQRDFHERHIAELAERIAYAEEQLRQHREASAALSDALMTLDMGAGMQPVAQEIQPQGKKNYDPFTENFVAHVVLADEIQSDIERAKRVVAPGEYARAC